MDQAGIYHQGIAKGKHHKGPRNAGNKSMISFRAGHGVTGYVGYIPSSESIPIPIKEGPSTRGPPVNRERAVPEDAAVVQAERELHSSSIYQNTILCSTASRVKGAAEQTGLQSVEKLELGATNESDMLEPQKPPTPRFLGKSMYQASYSSQSPTTTSMTTRGFRRRPAFLTGSTYAATHENSMEIKHGVGWLDFKQPRPSQTFVSKWKEVVVQRKSEPSSYEMDFGFFGSGIAGQLPPAGDKNMSDVGTTRSLFAGTSKSFRRLPGYSGFLPASDKNNRNEVALRQAQDDHERSDPKACRLFTLNQYLLDIPGTVSFHPKDATNLMEEPKGRSGTATWFANSYVSNPEHLARIARNRAAEEYFGASQETKKFFQGGELSQSENGKKNAERFFKLTRPREGVPRILRPSATTESGYHFGCYTDSV